MVSIFREHTVGSVTNPPSLPHCLTVNSDAVCFDAYHALTVEGAPGTFPLSAGNGKVPAADDAGRLESVASALNLLGISGVELQGADGAIKLSELHRDDAAASVEDEALDEGSLVGSNEGAGHGKNRRRGSRLVA